MMSSSRTLCAEEDAGQCKAPNAWCHELFLCSKGELLKRGPWHRPALHISEIDLKGITPRHSSKQIHSKCMGVLPR